MFDEYEKHSNTDKKSQIKRRERECTRENQWTGYHILKDLCNIWLAWQRTLPGSNLMINICETECFTMQNQLRILCIYSMPDDLPVIWHRLLHYYLIRCELMIRNWFINHAWTKHSIPFSIQVEIGKIINTKYLCKLNCLSYSNQSTLPSFFWCVPIKKKLQEKRFVLF